MSSVVDRTVVRMKDFRPQLNDGVQALTSQAVTVAKSTDGFVRANPWAAVGIVAAAGLVAGLLSVGSQMVRRRRSTDGADSASADAN